MLSRLSPPVRRLLVRLPIAGGAALALWLLGAGDLHERLLTAVTEPALRLFERPAATFLTWEAGSVLIRRSDFSSRSPIPGVDATPIAANLVLFLALLGATPGFTERRALRGAALAGLLLVASQVVHLALTVETLYATQLGAWSEYAYTRFQRELAATGRYFFDIALKYALPFVLWGVFVAVPVLRKKESDEEAEANRAAEKRRAKKKRR